MVTTRTLTVKQNNIDPAFQNAKAEESVLSILYAQDGLSFLVRHITTRQVYMTGFIPAQELGADPLQEVLGGFPDRPSQVKLIVAFDNATLLPEAFAADTAEWAAKLLGGKVNYTERSTKLGMEVLALVSEEEKNLASTTKAEVQHLWLSQMEALSPKQGEEVWVHLLGSRMLFLAAKEGKWELVNSYPCADQQEFIYHLGNAVEQLGYDRATLKLELSGFEAASYKEFIAPYFAEVSLFKSKNWAQISSAMQGWDPGAYALLLRL
ncbi:MAG: DUF3822 family protein [Schleiferiaceae bacterium]